MHTAMLQGSKVSWIIEISLQLKKKGIKTLGLVWKYLKGRQKQRARNILYYELLKYFVGQHAYHKYKGFISTFDSLVIQNLQHQKNSTFLNENYLQ